MLKICLFLSIFFLREICVIPIFIFCMSWLLLHSRTTIPISSPTTLQWLHPPSSLSQRMKSQKGQHEDNEKQQLLCSVFMACDFCVLFAAFTWIRVLMYWNWFVKRRNFLNLECFILAIWSLYCLVWSSLRFVQLFWHENVCSTENVYVMNSFLFEFVLVSLVFLGLFSLRTSGGSLHLEYLFTFSALCLLSA